MRVNRFISKVIIVILLFVPIALSLCIPYFVFVDLLEFDVVTDTFTYVSSLIASKSLTVILLIRALYYGIGRVRYLINYRIRISPDN